jgi:hypothetical protein
VYAAGAGLLDDFLKTSVAIIEKTSSLGSGSFGNYLINTNSKASLFLECLRDQRSRYLPKAARSDAAFEIGSHGDRPIAMKKVGDFLRMLGQDIQDAVDRSGASSVLTRHYVDAIHIADDGTYNIQVSSPDGRALVNGRKLVLGLGASPLRMPKLHRDVLARCHNAGASSILPMHSGELLCQSGYERAVEHLKQHSGGRVLIVGGGDSAFSSAWLLLQSASVEFDTDAIILAYRSRPKVTFDTVEEAQQAGYQDFSERDVCSKSGIVFRIGGLRYDAKELYQNVIEGCEKRIRLVRFPAVSGEADSIEWKNIALVVFATGYVPNEVPFYERDGSPVSLLGSFGGKYVDGRSRVLRSNGDVLANVYAIGMCSGFLPMEGDFGGEASFDGLANSVMLCHGPVGGLILDGLVTGGAPA